MTELYFIRHGQASFGHPEYDRLSTVGERQASLLGGYFRERGIRFDAVYCGSMRRQMRTASIVMDHMNGHGEIDIVVDENLNESDGSDRMMNRIHSMMQEDPDLHQTMGNIHTHHGAVEKIFDIAEQRRLLPTDEATRLRMAKQFRGRIIGAIQRVVSEAHNHRRVAVFTSGGPTTVALGQALETRREQTLRLGRELKNTSFTILRYEKERFGLVLFNCIAHLQEQNDPDLITYI